MPMNAVDKVVVTSRRHKKWWITSAQLDSFPQKENTCVKPDLNSRNTVKSRIYRMFSEGDAYCHVENSPLPDREKADYA